MEILKIKVSEASFAEFQISFASRKTKVSDLWMSFRRDIAKKLCDSEMGHLKTGSIGILSDETATESSDLG